MARPAPGSRDYWDQAMTAGPVAGRLRYRCPSRCRAASRLRDGLASPGRHRPRMCASGAAAPIRRRA
jgi:hypothetical protein